MFLTTRMKRNETCVEDGEVEVVDGHDLDEAVVDVLKCKWVLGLAHLRPISNSLTKRK